MYVEGLHCCKAELKYGDEAEPRFPKDLLALDLGPAPKLLHCRHGPQLSLD